MIRDHFRVLVFDLAAGKGRVEETDGRDSHIGGSGLAALLYDTHGLSKEPWNHPDQPLIFAIGPLTGFFPLMSKTVCAFKSPYHDQFAESHAGGRSALALRLANVDALVVTGKAESLSCLAVGARLLQLDDVEFMRGMDVFSAGKLLRRMYPGAGHRSILRIGPAGERSAATACINVDSYRHFGRLGAGAVMGAKNLKGIFIHGDGIGALPEGKKYSKLYRHVYQQLTSTEMMRKYHDLGTPSNVSELNQLESLPIRNLQKTTGSEIEDIAGEKFAEHILLRNQACSGCPIGCIHLGYVRKKFMQDHRYYFLQVPYDYEPIYATGAMLGITDPFEVLGIIDVVDKMGLDIISTGVAMAWATEATDNELVSKEETVETPRFGDAATYKKIVRHMAYGTNGFYRRLSNGIMQAVEQFGGEAYACVLGQEMAGYATGEVFFVSQALGFRHSHLDTGGYSYDQNHNDRDTQKALDFLIEEERFRVLLTSMVSCLFARKVYKKELLEDCLKTLGYETMAGEMDTVAEQIQRLRWRIRLESGYDPRQVKIPKRLREVTNRQGSIDETFLNSLKSKYANRIRQFANP